VQETNVRFCYKGILKLGRWIAKQIYLVHKKRENNARGNATLYFQLNEINGNVFFLCGLGDYVDASCEKFVQNTLNQMLSL